MRIPAEQSASTRGVVFELARRPDTYLRHEEDVSADLVMGVSYDALASERIIGPTHDADLRDRSMPSGPSSVSVRSDQDLAACHRLPVVLDCARRLFQSHTRSNSGAEFSIEEPWNTPLEQDKLAKRLRC